MCPVADVTAPPLCLSSQPHSEGQMTAAATYISVRPGKRLHLMVNQTAVLIKVSQVEVVES